MTDWLQPLLLVVAGVAVLGVVVMTTFIWRELGKIRARMKRLEKIIGIRPFDDFK